MLKTKTLIVTGNTTTHNGQQRKDLPQNIDAALNAFLAENPGIEVKNVILNTSITGTQDTAIILLLYVGKEVGKGGSK